MTPEKATALRAKFPQSAVGQLPKPTRKDATKGQCRECGGWHGLPAVHLDYVGHAATTDRLLSVDPEWTWEPMGVDQFGLPMPDAQGNLWIRLTVCGVTRIGVGDGSSVKEKIGDAIRNAAMRFGVALDLWSKEELEQSDGKVGGLETSAASPPPAVEDSGPPPPVNLDGPMGAKTRGRMFALFSELGIDDETEQRSGMARVVGHEVESRGKVTEGEARQVIAALEARKNARQEASDER